LIKEMQKSIIQLEKKRDELWNLKIKFD
jgi:hypothetical protein